MVTATGAQLKTARVLGVTAFAAVFVAYIWDSARALSYDSADTRQFIVSPSLWDPLHRQVGYNNHVLFSFLDHLVYLVAGGSNTALRVLPAAAGAAAVGLMVGVLASRLGVLAGVTAGFTLALSPDFVAQAREVRGYSLVILMAVLSSCLLLWAEERRGNRLRSAYVACVAAAVATHLFAVGFVFVQFMALLAARRMSRQWLFAMTAGVVLGAVVLAGVLPVMLRFHHGSARAFQPHFPVDELKTSLGEAYFTGSRVVPLIFGVLSLAGVWELRRSKALWGGLIGIGVVLVLAWIWGPAVLTPRFFDWTLPLTALLAGVAIARWHLLAPLAAIAVVVSLGQFQGPNAWNLQRYAWLSAVHEVQVVHQHHGLPCVLAPTSLDQPLYGYLRDFRNVATTAGLRGCTEILRVTENVGQPLLTALRGKSRIKTFPAFFPTTVYR